MVEGKDRKQRLVMLGKENKFRAKERFKKKL